MEADPRIIEAIDNAVAANRWRVAARFESGETAAQYRRLGDKRSALARELLAEIGNPAGRITQPGRPVAAHREGGRVDGPRIRSVQPPDHG